MSKPVGVLIKVFTDSSVEVYCPFYKKKPGKKKRLCAVNFLDECVFTEKR